jgi:hypothetical protein
MEASAIAAQVEEIARSIARDKENVGTQERTQALDTLVELKRLEQLKAIAASQSNSTYFFGDQSALGRQATDAYNVDYAEQVKSSMGGKAPSSKNNRLELGAL